MPVSTEEQSIETQLALMNQMWDQHTQQDMVQFEALAAQLTEMNAWLGALDDKLDAAAIREATRTGEADATKRFAGYISMFISLAIGTVSLLLGFYVSG
jgi:hypothetical protein